MSDELNRTVTFQLDAEDYLAANKLHTRSSLRRPLSAILGALIFLSFGVFVFLTWVSPPETLLDYIVTTVVFCAISTPIVRVFVWLPYKSRKVYREQKNLQYQVTASWSIDGLKTENQRGSMLIPWDDFFKWDEDDRMLLLYHSSLLFQMLPKRAFADAQLTDLHQFIKIPRR